MTKKYAFLFPGQGSQYVGMGSDLSDEFPDIREIFEALDDICGKPISRLCFKGPLDDLTLTINLQPAVTAVNLACLTALGQNGVEADIAAGHSLGEFAAMVSSGVISWQDALRCVNARGEFMHRESLSNPGVMAAVLGMNIDEVTKIVEESSAKGILAVANHNTAEQIVITGQKEPLDFAIRQIKEMGKRAIPLQVSGAWHCELMRNAVKDFRDFMDPIPFSEPKKAILFNATGMRETDPLKIKDIMAQQLVSPVKWYDIIMTMINEGVDTFIEVGPKKVLTGIVNKIIPKGTDLKVYNVGDLKTFRAFLEAEG